MRIHVHWGTAVMLLLGPAIACAQQVKVFNSSFEQPVITTAGGSIADPTAAQQGAGAGDSPWVFSGAAGIAAKGAQFGFVTLSAPPDGNQAGYVDQGGQFSQALSFPANGTYVLNYQEAGDGIYTVKLDQTVIVASHITPSSFAKVSATFDTAAGMHTLTFVDTDPREIASPVPAFIDQVSVSVVPEPGSVATLGLAVSGSLLRRPR